MNKKLNAASDLSDVVKPFQIGRGKKNHLQRTLITLKVSFKIILQLMVPCLWTRAKCEKLRQRSEEQLCLSVQGYDDVPRPQSQPVWPEAFIEGEESLVPPRLHHSVQRSFVQGASRQNPLVHHARPHHVHRVGGQRSRQAAGKTGTASRSRQQARLAPSSTVK